MIALKQPANITLLPTRSKLAVIASSTGCDSHMATDGYLEISSAKQADSLTLGAHASEGYSSCPVCLSVCVCLLLLFWLCVQYSVLPKVPAVLGIYIRWNGTVEWNSEMFCVGHTLHRRRKIFLCRGALAAVLHMGVWGMLPIAMQVYR